MRISITLTLWLGAALASPLAAQPTAPRLHPDVPAAFDVAGLHLVLNAEAQRLVQQKADGLCRHQPSFQARVDMADAAFPVIDRVLKAEGVPLDFRYLVLQESALQGDARSPHEAVGYWQLKQETATELGLVVSDAVDERQHLAASTRAAARYLTRSNATLHNWLNALLSYNTGLTGVKPYTLPTDADATQIAVTEATSPYVLMFLAQKLAFEPACGQNPRPALRLQEFPALPGQTLEAQALALHVEPAALAAHNHWLLAPAVPADRPYTLIVPVGDITQAAGIAANQRLQASGELLAQPAVARNAAEVQLNGLRALIALPGETTADLARRGGQRLGEFLHHNELTAFDVAAPGRPYYLESKRDAAAVEYHVVQPGETVFDVAQKYGLRKKAILAKNRLAPADALAAGRVLWLQHTRPREVPVEFRTLPEGVALERVRNAPRPDAAATPAAVGATTRVRRDAEDGWGETVPAAVGRPAVAPAPASVARTAAAPPATSPLPPRAPAPAPAPLADEPAPAEADVALPTAAGVVQPALSAPTPVPTAVRPTMSPAARPSVAAPATVPAATPPTISAAPTVGKSASPAAAAAPTAGAVTHRVEAGETVYSISRRYQLAPADLMALNQLTPPAGLAVGQVLQLTAVKPATSPPAAAVPAEKPASAAPGNPALYAPQRVAAPAADPAAAPAGAAAQHTVAKTETLYSIAKRYGVTVAELQAWNGKLDGSVRIGEVLRVQAGE